MNFGRNVVFSADPCYNEDNLVGRGLAPAVMKDFVLCNGGTKAPPYKGYGLCPKPLRLPKWAGVKQRRNWR